MMVTPYDETRLFVTLQTDHSRIAGFLVAVEYYGLGVDYIDNYPRYINSFTKEDVMNVAKKYLDDKNFTLVVVADQEKAALRNEWK